MSTYGAVAPKYHCWKCLPSPPGFFVTSPQLTVPSSRIGSSALSCSTEAMHCSHLGLGFRVKVWQPHRPTGKHVSLGPSHLSNRRPTARFQSCHCEAELGVWGLWCWLCGSALVPAFGDYGSSSKSSLLKV